VALVLEHLPIALQQPQPAVVCGDEELLRLPWHCCYAGNLFAAGMLPPLVAHIHLHHGAVNSSTNDTVS
jgi:hypothetical protein